MNDIEKLTLIEDSFSSDDAKEILNKIFSSKINYYNIKNWSSQERYGKDDETAQKRIPELRKEMERLQNILSLAKLNKKKLAVISEISIKQLDE